MLFKSFDDPEFDDISTSLTTVAICDWETFLGDTLMEKWESIYIKLVEMKNILKAKAEDNGLDAGKFAIRAGEFTADIMECSGAYCFGKPPDRSVDLPFIGELTIGGDECKVFWDKGLPRNKVVVECEFGKGLLIINNIPQLAEQAEKDEAEFLEDLKRMSP